jgi:YD repeat-containing protein
VNENALKASTHPSSTGSTLLVAAWIVLCPTLALAATSYIFDTLNRLTGVDYGNGTTISYSYDAAGNRLTRVVAAADDTTPDAYSFAPRANWPLSSVAVSEPITVSGINVAAPISITSGEYSIDGGGWTATGGTVNAGQAVQVRLTSSASYSTATSATLNIGGLVGAFTVTTRSAGQTTTTTALASSINPSFVGQPVTFTATVTGSAPTGSVTFRDGLVPITDCGAVPLASGQAACLTSALLVGSHSITAIYSGDAGHAASTSPTVVQSVGGFQLAVSTGYGGSVDENPNLERYAPGAVVTLTALPIADYAFSAWSGDVIGNANPVLLTMSADRSVGAAFTPILVPTDTIPSSAPIGGGAASTVVVIPLVARTASFTSEIFVSNASPSSINVNLRFYGARGTTGAGLNICTTQSIPAQSTVALPIAIACPSLPSSSQYGLLVLEEALRRTPLSVYSRTANPHGNGFSIEGYPIGEFSAGGATVTGLKRIAVGPPPFQSNCFVGALGEGVDYQIVLTDGSSGAAIGSPVTGSLVAWETLRMLDIFGPAGANAPAGDYGNVRADFSAVGTARAALVGYCTVQDNYSFGADFRLAKSRDADDASQRRVVHLGHDGTGVLIDPAIINDLTRKHVYVTALRHPDALTCSVVGPRSADLELRLREPGPLGTTTVRAGGNNQASFAVDIGGRDSVNAGVAGYWALEVSFREGGSAAVPIAYGLTCTSGNGMSEPLLLNPVGFSDDF